MLECTIVLNRRIYINHARVKLDLVLTGGRLSKYAKNLITKAYAQTLGAGYKRMGMPPIAKHPWGFKKYGMQPTGRKGNT